MIGSVIKLIRSALASCCLGSREDDDHDHDHHGSYTRLQGHSPSQPHYYRDRFNNKNNNPVSSSSSSTASPNPSKAAATPTLKPTQCVVPSWSSPTNVATEKKKKNEESPARSKLPAFPISGPSPAFPFPEETTSSRGSPYPSKVAESPTLKPTLRLFPPSSSSTGEKGTEAKYLWVQKKGKSPPVYEIPENVECLIKQDKLPSVLLLRKPLSASTYRDFFAALLYAEDHYLEKWSDFKLLSVDLELKQAAVYNKARSSTDHIRNAAAKHEKKTFVSFVVDAVREKRPFLLSRDFVFTRPSNGGPNSPTFQGLIYRVERSTTILVEFGQDFFSQHRPTSKYDVSFSFNRVCLKRFHQGIEVASNHSCLRGFIFPDSLPITLPSTTIPPVSSHMFNHRLDQQQRTIVHQILSLQGPPPYLIEGQLAVRRDTFTDKQLSKTGLVLKEAVSQLYRRSGDHRILVCAPVNKTCDVLLEHLKEEIKEGDMFRANAAFREIDGVPPEILNSCAYKGECFTCPPLHELQRFRLVVSTYVTSFQLHSKGIGRGHFSHIFLVDASMAVEPEVMVALGNMADEKTAVIVTGAAGNTPRLVRSDVARKYGLMTSYFQRLKNSSKTYHGSSDSSMFISRLEEEQF